MKKAEKSVFSDILHFTLIAYWLTVFRSSNEDIDVLCLPICEMYCMGWGWLLEEKLYFQVFHQRKGTVLFH